MDEREKYPSEAAERFQIRMPAGLRDRIRKAAERSGRSMNTEIVAALETFYPEEPTIEELLDRVHDAIEMAQTAGGMPYRKVLIEALDELSQQVATGMELDQFRAPHIGPEYRDLDKFADRHRRWKRVQRHGVETADFERQLKRGMFSKLSGDRVWSYIRWFNQGREDVVMKNLRLSETNFVDKPAVIALLRQHLEDYYRENWGEYVDRPPWEQEDDF